jgi:hypothetical protein
VTEGKDEKAGVCEASKPSHEAGSRVPSCSEETRDRVLSPAHEKIRFGGFLSGSGARHLSTRAPIYGNFQPLDI